MTEIKAEPFFKIDLSDGTHLSFDDIEQIGLWIQAEQAAFQWLNDGAQAAGVGQLREEYNSGLNNLAQYLQKLRNDQSDTQAAQSLLNVFQGTYSSPRIVRSTHEFARIASGVANRDGRHCSVCGASFLVGHPLQDRF